MAFASGQICRREGLPSKRPPLVSFLKFFFQIYHTVQFKTIPQTTERTGQQADMVSNTDRDRVVSLVGHLNRWYSTTRQNWPYL